MAILESLSALTEVAKMAATEVAKSQIAEKLGTSATEGLKANEHVLRQASQAENFRVGELPNDIFDKETSEIAEAEVRNSLLEKLGENPSLESTEPENLAEAQIPGQEEVRNEISTPEIEEVEVASEKQGGSYGELKKFSNGETHENHHMPADSSYKGLEYDEKPAVKMEKMDHRQTASWGNSLEARAYRSQQKELLDAGKFDEAVQMDIDDIREKFGNKYDKGISEMKEYVERLKQEGRLKEYEND